MARPNFQVAAPIRARGKDRTGNSFFGHEEPDSERLLAAPLRGLIQPKEGFSRVLIYLTQLKKILPLDGVPGRTLLKSTGMMGPGSIGIGGPCELAASSAYGSSSDGGLIVGATGECGGNGQGRGFVWDDVTGMRLLEDVLEDHGVDLEGWDLLRATGVSDDGNKIVGYGRHPNGYIDGWLVTVPEPTTAVLFGIGMMGLTAKRRRRRTGSIDGLSFETA